MGRHAKWTPDKIDEIVERLKKGERYSDIAADYGVTVKSLYGVTRKYPRASIIVRDTRVLTMAERWEQGVRVEQIAEEFHIKPATVYATASAFRDIFPRRCKK